MSIASRHNRAPLERAGLWVGLVSDATTASGDA